MSGAAVLAAARAMIGVRFRPHGRDAAAGVDCVGLVALALAGAGRQGAVPDDYPLHSGDAAQVAAALAAAGLVAVEAARPGDVLLYRSGPGQLHLAVQAEDGIVHADLIARRVVERPGVPPWPVIGRWRWQGKD
ncbi:peptidoglycan endopeptidase [Sphingomonas sp. RS6]